VLRKFFHFIHDTSVSLYRLSNGKFGGRVQGLQVLLLTTIGRKTGEERTTHSDTLWMRAITSLLPQTPGEIDTAWFHNLRAGPHLKIEIKDRQLEAEAEVASSEKRGLLWSQLISLSPAYANYTKKTNREIPLVILHPLKNG
jgi:deazaflavin-dependent oxidoreductase (nitroreductase family)